MDFYGQAWLIWVLMFVGIEGAAIFNKRPGDTLSERVWRFIGKRGYTLPTGYKVRRGALAVFLAWLMGHFLGGM